MRARRGRGPSRARVRTEAAGGTGPARREERLAGRGGASHRSAPAAETEPRPRRLAWADLLRRVFAIDVLECPRCGARTRLLAAIHPPEATSAILECLALPARAPPIEVARQEEEAGASWDPVFDDVGA